MGAQPHLQSKQRGFTLIELMVVVTIVAVLAAIALPAYQNQVLRSNRAAAKTVLLDIANRQEQYLLSNRVYASTVADLGFALPTDVDRHYQTPAMTVTNTGLPYFQITITPNVGGNQAADGPLTLDSAGVRGPAAKWER